MSFKLHLITEGFHSKRCNFPDIPYLSETQKNDFRFLKKKESRSNKSLLLYPFLTFFFIVPIRRYNIK